MIIGRIGEVEHSYRKRKKPSTYILMLPYSKRPTTCSALKPESEERENLMKNISTDYVLQEQLFNFKTRLKTNGWSITRSGQFETICLAPFMP